MGPYEGLDSWEVRWLILDEIVDYANEFMQKIKN